MRCIVPPPASLRALGLLALLAALTAPPAATQVSAGGGQAVAYEGHPRLLLDAAGVRALRERIERYPWARAHWEQLRRGADTLLGRPVQLPHRGGTWVHWYVSPTDGQRLRTGRQIGPARWEHISTSTGEVFQGDSSSIRTDYDGVVILEIHRAWSRAVRDLGLAFQVTGDRRYADKAREILLAYADRYLTYPLMNKQGGAEMDGNGRARVTKQSLSEASWLVPLVQGADLVWAMLPDADRQRVTNRLLQPAAREVVLAHRYNQAHNIQAWKNAAVGLVGLLTGDDELVQEAVHNPREGYFFQLAQGLTPDGHWYERAPSYHFFTVEPLVILAEAMRNAGMNPDVRRIKPMLDAPLALARPDLTIGRYNDADPVDLRERTAFYEWGYATFGDPRYLAVLREAGRGAEGGRRADPLNYSLLYGHPSLPAAPAPAGGSENYPASGFAVLARGSGPGAVWLSLKYDPFAGGHSHPDRLTFDLYARGAALSEDPGRTGYGAAVHQGWYKTTLSHNSLVVDEQPQQRDREGGRTLAFGSQGGVEYAVLDAGAAYPDVTFRRTAILLDPGLVLLVDQVRADRPRLLDLAFHPHGALHGIPAGQGWTPPDSVGYRYLRDATIRPLSGPVTVHARQPDGPVVAVTYGLLEPAELIAATAPGPSGRTVSTLLLRHRAAEAALPWALELDGEPVALEGVPVLDAAGAPLSAARAAAVRVARRDGRAWLVLTNPDRHPVRIAMPGGGELATDEPFAVRVLPSPR